MVDQINKQKVVNITHAVNKSRNKTDSLAHRGATLDSMQQKQQYNRQRNRRSLCYNLRVFDKTTNRVAGYINNISEDGAGLMTEYPVAQNERRYFKIELPRQTRKKLIQREVIEVEAVSAWTEKKVDGSFYSCGFRFLTMDNVNRSRLSHLINHYRR